MRSQKQIDASRANGAKSRGPITPEGKAISAGNASRRRLRLRRDVVLDCEPVASFETLLQQCIEHIKPRDAFELTIVEDLAAASWRRHRAHGVETRLLQNVTHVRLDDDPIDRVSNSFAHLSTSPGFNRISLYQLRHDHLYLRALRSIVLARKIADYEPRNSPQSAENTVKSTPPTPKNEPNSEPD